MNYAEMSDFEINKAVAEKLFKDVVGLIVTRDVPTRDRVIGFKDLDGEIVSFICVDYCNSWADAGPIIHRDFIALSAEKTDAGHYIWFAFSCEKDGYKQIASNNPLRAAMIVFLMVD